MKCAVMLQTQISAIMDVMVKAAVAEISQLLEDDAAALHGEIQKRNEEIQKRNEEIQKRNEEIQRRNEEIQGLKARLSFTETKLRRLTADRCSVAVQLEMMDTSVRVYSQEPRADGFGQEKTAMTVENLSEEKPHMARKAMTSSEELREDDDVSGLEFEMKIEQVEELVDEKPNEIHAEPSYEAQNHGGHDDRTSHSWPSGGQIEHQSFPDSYEGSGYFGAMLENESFGALGRKDVEFDLLDAHRRSPTRTGPTNSDAFGGFSPSRLGSCLAKTFTRDAYVENHTRRNPRPKPFRCEECGTGFTQKTRLITHRRVHTGEKPFRCQLCGKTFSRQDNCLRHVRLHNGQR